MWIPLHLPRFASAALPSVTLLAADLGSNQAKLGFFHIKGQQLSLVTQQNYPGIDLPGFPKLLHKFLMEQKLPQPTRLSLGVNGSILNGKVYVHTQETWIDKKTLQETTGIQTLSLINRLEASAYGLANLQDKYIQVIHEGNRGRTGNIALLEVEEKLGEAALYWDGEKYHPFSSAGAYVDFSPRDALDLDLYAFMQGDQTTLSWHQVLSDSGIVQIYHFLQQEKGLEAHPHIHEKSLRTNLAMVIAEAGIIQEDVLCQQTMRTYIRLLAYEAANLVLKLKATGGLFLGGALIRKIAPLLHSEHFIKHFTQNAAMEDLLSQVPTNLLLEADTGLWGAAYYGAYGP